MWSHTRHERRVPELRQVLGSQPQVTEAINRAVSCHYFPPDYLLSCRASPPFDWYQILLLGGISTCVSNFPKVAFGSVAVGIRTRDLYRKSGSLTSICLPGLFFSEITPR